MIKDSNLLMISLSIVPATDSLTNIGRYFKEQANIIIKHSTINYNLLVARLIFRWIANNISYDVEAWLKDDFENTDNLDYIFLHKKTCCAGYAYVFNHLCMMSGIPTTDVQITGGTAKGILKPNENLYVDEPLSDLNKNGYKLDELSEQQLGNLRAVPNHAWNIVLIGEKWELIDSTWASGILVMENNKYKFVRILMTFGFVLIQLI